MSRDPKYYPHWLIYIDVVQLVGCQTPLHGQVVDKSGSGKIRAQHLDMSRCWALAFFVRWWQICNRQVVDKL